MLETVAAARKLFWDDTSHRAGALSREPGLLNSFWLLTQIVFRSRRADFWSALGEVGVSLPEPDQLTSPLLLVSAVCEKAEDLSYGSKSRSIFSDVAVASLRESLATALSTRTPGLFGVSGQEIQKACSSYASATQFGLLARNYFSIFLFRCIDYFISKELHNHTGPGKRFETVFETTGFREALRACAYERAAIVEQFAGAWTSKEDYEGGVTLEDIGRFMPVALKKLAAELALVESE